MQMKINPYLTYGMYMSIHPFALQPVKYLHPRTEVDFGKISFHSNVYCLWQGSMSVNLYNNSTQSYEFSSIDYRAYQIYNFCLLFLHIMYRLPTASMLFLTNFVGICHILEVYHFQRRSPIIHTLTLNMQMIKEENLLQRR